MTNKQLSDVIEETTDFSEGNLEAHKLLQRCIKEGYSIRIDDLELTEYPDKKIISLKPSKQFATTIADVARREKELHVLNWVYNMLSDYDKLATLGYIEGKIEALNKDTTHDK